MDRAQGLVTISVVALWLVLHVVDCVVDVAFGGDWQVPAEVDVAMGSVIAAVLGGPKLLRALGKNGNGKNGNGAVPHG